MSAVLALDIEGVYTNSRWQLTAAVLTYALVVFVTNRVLITAPACYQLFQNVDEESAELMLTASAASIAPVETRPPRRRKAASSAPRVPQGSTLEAAVLEIGTMLASAGNRVGRRSRGGWKVRISASLARVVAGRRYLHSAERLRCLHILPREDAIVSEACIMQIRLSEVDSPRARRLSVELKDALVALRTSITDRQDTSEQQRVRGLAILLSEARRVAHDAEDVRLEHAAERQRRVLWLTLVGLLLVLVFGLSGRREVLLFGALGGVLAPLTNVWQRTDRRRDGAAEAPGGEADYVSSWGELLLGPVAGALAAYGGLLLVTFLASENLNLLDEIFRVWDEPTAAFAFALALLFGFSGGLFGSVALKASGQVVPPTSAAAAQHDLLDGPATGDQLPPPPPGAPVSTAPPGSGGGAPARAAPSGSEADRGSTVLHWLVENAGLMINGVAASRQASDDSAGGDERESTGAVPARRAPSREILARRTRLAPLDAAPVPGDDVAPASGEPTSDGADDAAPRGG